MLSVRMQSKRFNFAYGSAQRASLLFRDFPGQFLVDHLFENIEWLRSYNGKSINKESWC